tara:strand:+ start:398 stop:601 length:204 start_codon:yes stop_codon:yes gene_type:complete
MEINLKNLRIVDRTEQVKKLLPIKKELIKTSHLLEYKLANPKSERKLISEDEIFISLRKIIDLVEKL